jgi:hypothetical protein
MTTREAIAYTLLCVLATVAITLCVGIMALWAAALAWA